MASCNAGIVQLKMSSKKAIEATGEAGQGGSGGQAKHTELLSDGEFREHFVIPNGVSIQLLEGDVVPTHKAEDNSICFTKEQFNVRLRLPLPSASDSSQRGLGADGLQHSGHVVQFGPILTRDSLRLHYQEGKERHFQSDHQYSFVLAGDWPP